RDMGTEGIYYGGYGYASFHFAEAFQALDWDPPRIMGTAVMFYSNNNTWAAGIEGWHGIDQLGEDGAHANYNAMRDRFEKRFGRATGNVVVALAYDTARVAIHGIANALVPAPPYVRDGIERIRWMPSTNGGPGTYIQFGPGDHKGYKGDFLTIRELRDSELRFVGYHRPEWPSNRTAIGGPRADVRLPVRLCGGARGWRGSWSRTGCRPARQALAQARQAASR